jgi:TPP-dependent pyruvate/acetoin dehydrogenase alpha subunit
VERARAGEGPSLLLCNTYRYHGHHVGDVSREYYALQAGRAAVADRARSDQDLAIGSLRKGSRSRAARKIHDEVKTEIDSAVQFALAAPYPSPDKVDQDVYA